MSDTEAKDCIRRWERMKAARSQLETLWQEIAELVRPQRADFTARVLEGQKRGLLQYDASSATALDQLAAGLWGSVTNSATEWFQVRHPDPGMNEDAGVKLWNDGVREVMRDALGAEGQRFYTQVLELYTDLGAFGTGIFWADEDIAAGRLAFSNRALVECCIDQDDRERVDTVIRKFQWTARQAVMRWGDKAPEAARKLMAAEKPDEPLAFLHAVYPNDGKMPGRRDVRGKAWLSHHICIADQTVVQRGGYEEFPYQVVRWGTAQRGLYGESPAMKALTDIKVLNRIERNKLVAGEKAADPPLLAPDENAFRGIRVQPGGITYGGVDSEGRPLVRPLEGAADFRVFEGMADQKRQAVREAFHNTLMLMQGRANATATEVLEIKEERLRLLGPQLSRIETEFLDPLTRRVFGLLWRAGAFPPPPDALAADARVKVEYVSQLAVAQRSGGAAAIMRALSNIMPLAQARPDVLDNLDFDEASRRIADGFGAPPAILRDPRKVEAERKQRAQAAAAAQQAQMVAGAMPAAAQGARAVKDLMAAEATAQGMEAGA
jgi:hypothetical protein